MSDLQCPATLLVTRHGHAASSTPGLLSDDGGWLTDVGMTQMVALATRLGSDPSVNVGAVVTSHLARAVQCGRLVGRALGLSHEVLQGIEEWTYGDLVGHPATDPRYRRVVEAWRAGDLQAAWPGGESGRRLVNRFRDALEGLADEHRGRSVLVLTHGGIMSIALPVLCPAATLPIVSDTVTSGVPVRVRVDADGWAAAPEPPGTQTIPA